MNKVIIGGGPAGIFAAIHCKEKHPKSTVIVLEKTNQLLSKVRISGGGRCNVTHACFDPQKLVKNYPRGSKELLGPFHRFGPKETLEWFNKRGVLTKIEEDGRIFPITDSSSSIIECLLESASRAGVEIRKQQPIESIDSLDASAILIATGSAPWGYKIAEQLGHTIVPPVPSLFTFNVPSSPLLDLAGISVPNATLSIANHRQTGPLLLTHWGFSGPSALKLSAWAARDLHALNYKATLLINWTSSNSAEALFAKLRPLKQLPSLLPANLQMRLLNFDPTLPLSQVSNQKLMQFCTKLHADPYIVEGKTTYKQEFVTAGGVSLKEINFKTMESKIRPGLFFAGEILDIDGITGGFNFQNAWTTGYLAGLSL